MSGNAQITTISKPAFGSKLAVRTAAPEIIETETNLFEGIMGDTIPTMPEHLKPYDVGVNNEIARVESEAVFLTWLNVQLTGRPTMADSEARLACREAENVNVFFPEWADPNDFRTKDAEGKVIDITENVDDIYEYRRQNAIADIDTAAAKAECAACPMRVQCLTRSIMLDETGNDSGVWGGWGEAGRRTIQAKFDITRRYYQAGRRSMQEMLSEEDHVGMPIEQIAKVEKRARALTPALTR